MSTDGAEILSTKNLYKQSKFSQRIETTQPINAFHPLSRRGSDFFTGIYLTHKRLFEAEIDFEIV
ncbi:hypothetical protein L0337_32730 [candidate division KSB1 bacterium]|nr:hypothetical protein [candidate division KSB1 bacterium]